MRQYEVVYIMDPQLEEAQHNTLVERFQGIVTAQGGEVQHIDRWERRRMAYEIKGRREGYYVVMNFQGAPAVEAELDRVFGITDGILRHLITRMDDRRAARAIAEAKAAAEAKARAQAEARAAAEASAAAAEAEAAEVEAAARARQAGEDATQGTVETESGTTQREPDTEE